MKLDHLEQLHRDAKPQRWRVGKRYRRLDKTECAVIEYADGREAIGPLFALPEAELLVAARNTLPLLLAVARAADALANGAYGYGHHGEHRVAILGTRWVELRVALEALDNNKENSL